jgi:hypothetical protein
MLYQMRSPMRRPVMERGDVAIAATRGLHECPRAWSLLCRDEIETQVITFGGTLLSGERCRSDQPRVPLRDLVGSRRSGPAPLSDIGNMRLSDLEGPATFRDIPRTLCQLQGPLLGKPGSVDACRVHTRWEGAWATR